MAITWAEPAREDLIDLAVRGGVVVAVLLLALALVQALWLWLAPPPPLPTLGEQIGGAQLPTAPSIPLADYHLFGNGPQPGAAVSQTPTTTLNLTLKGTFTAAVASQARALIADPEGEGSYTPGMFLPGGARLESVHSDHVILRVDGRSEKLSLGTAALDTRSAGGSARATTRSAPAPGMSPPVPSLPGQSASFVNPVAGNSAAAFEALRAQAVADPAALARSVTALPVIEGGRFVGVRLNAGSHQQLLSRAGVQPNDIVTEVNGIRIDSLGRGAEIAQQLQNARSVRLTVRRDGQDLPLPPINLDSTP
ncbi:MAG: type II secretion system protein N [Lysobacterales bacterium]